MRQLFPTVAMVILLSCLLLWEPVVDAFVVPPVRHVTTPLGHSCLFSNHNMNNDDRLFNWTMDMDWALQDAVPRFTVFNKDGRPVTFWNQLLQSLQQQQQQPTTSILTEAQLQERYRVLSCSGNATTASPAVLSDWWVDDLHRRMGGTLSSSTTTGGGSSVWFYVQRGGNLATSSPSQSFYTPGGFVEATDGTIYELGPTTTTTEAVLGTSTTQVNANDDDDDANRMMIMDNTSTPRWNLWWMDVMERFQAVLFSGRQLTRQTRQLILLIVTLSSLWTGFLGFTIGHQMSSSSTTSNTPVVRMSTSTTVIRTSSSPDNTISIQEQRVRQELRVLREKRGVQTLQDRIQMDEQKLELLRQQEQAQGSVKN